MGPPATYSTYWRTPTAGSPDAEYLSSETMAASGSEAESVANSTTSPRIWVYLATTGADWR